MGDWQLGVGRGQIGWDALCVLGFMALFLAATIATILAMVFRKYRKD